MKAAWVHPSTISEKCFGAFVVLLGAIMFAVILGQINGIIRKIDESTVQRRNKLGTFKQFCTLNNVGPALEKKILAYALAEWNVTSGVSIAGAFGAAKLSPILRSSLIAEIHKDLLSTSGFFTRVSVGCAKQLLMKASTQVCLKNELLVGYGQMARELFIMIKGSLQISIPANVRKQSSKGGDDSNRKSVSKKQVMQFRILDRMGGITGMWRPGDNACPFPFEVLAKEFSTMLNISRVGMMEVLNNVSNVDRNEAFEMLQEEHEKTISALKMGGKRAPNARASKASSRPSEQENTEPAPPPAGEPDLTRSRDPILIAKDKLETLQETVTNVGVVLSTTKASASTLRDIYENISGTTTDRSGQETARSDGNGASSFDIKDAARTRAQERAEIMDKKRREAVESTEEKQQITKTSTDNNANLITSAMVL